MLAEVAEEGKARSKEGREAIKEYMKGFKEKTIKNIVLGCTHYPIYKTIIKEELGYEVNLINTGTSVANYLNTILSDEEKGKLDVPVQRIFLSKPTLEFKEIANNLLNEETQICEK